jgi:hypothetical protein
VRDSILPISELLRLVSCGWSLVDCELRWVLRALFAVEYTLAGLRQVELRRVVHRSSLVSMTTVADITGAVKRLPKKDLARFRKWFAEYDASVWDRQLKADATAGKLDALIREAQRDHRAGRTRAL